MRPTHATETSPITTVFTHASLPQAGRIAVMSPSKGSLVFDIVHEAAEVRVVVSSPYFVGSSTFRVRSAGAMVEILQDAADWRPYRSVADFIEHPEGVRLAFFDMNIRRQGAPEYDWRN